MQYKGDHNTLGFWYEWIKYKDRFEKSDIRQMVKCGDSMPILWKDRQGGALLGYLDNKTEFVSNFPFFITLLILHYDKTAHIIDKFENAFLLSASAVFGGFM